MCRKQAFVSVAVVLVWAIAVLAQDKSSAAPPEITFTVSMPKPYTHLFDVAVQIKRGAAVVVPPEETLVLPVWTPGSYLIREYARHVQDFAATDVAGHSLRWEKVNKDSWRVLTAGARHWRATYRVYANELSVRTSELNSDHAFWNNATLLMYPDGYIKSPSTLRINPQSGWKIATGLPAVRSKANTFRAENFDVLYDSPVEVSDFKVLSFDLKGVPHRIVIDGEGNYDPEMMRRDVRRIVEAEVDLM